MDGLPPSAVFFNHRGGEAKGGFAAFGGFFNHRGGEVKGGCFFSLNLPSSVVNFFLPKEEQSRAVMKPKMSPLRIPYSSGLAYHINHPLCRWIFNGDVS